MYKKYVEVDGANNSIYSMAVRDISTGELIKDWSGDKLATYSVITTALRNFSGKILTIIDASIPEGKQNKSIKDLIRSEFGEQHIWFNELLLDQAEQDKSINNIIESVNEIPFDDILKD